MTFCSRFVETEIKKWTFKETGWNGNKVVKV